MYNIYSCSTSSWHTEDKHHISLYRCLSRSVYNIIYIYCYLFTIYSLTNFAITVIIYCSFPLTGFVSVETFYRNVAPDLKINEYFARLIYLVVTVITAVFHPYLFPAVMFSGILGGTVLNLIIPACVQLCLLNSEEDKKLKCLCYLLIVSGIIILCVGLYSVHFGIMMKLTKDAGNNLWIST